MADDLSARLRRERRCWMVEGALHTLYEPVRDDMHEAADRIEVLEAQTQFFRRERDEARAENTKLREALSNLLDCVEEGPFSSHEQCGSAPAARAALADIEEADDADE